MLAETQHSSLAQVAAAVLRGLVATGRLQAQAAQAGLAQLTAYRVQPQRTPRAEAVEQVLVPYHLAQTLLRTPETEVAAVILPLVFLLATMEGPAAPASSSFAMKSPKPSTTRRSDESHF
jgi:hypothetical protein